LAAFQAVEDNLASLRVLSKELGERHNATVAGQRTVELSVVRYRNGVDSYLNVIIAQNTFLASRESELQVQLEQQIASVNLINNLGGGWTTSDWARTERLAGEAAAAAKRSQAPAAQTGADGSAPGTPNPPAMKIPDIRPEDLIKQNAEAMAPTPPADDQK
jgi:hypothetical protein